MSSEDEDDDGDDDDEVAVGVDWDVLEDEDTLTSGHPSVQGPLPFHAEGSESMRSVEAGESAASHGVPTEDRWMGGRTCRRHSRGDDGGEQLRCCTP